MKLLRHALPFLLALLLAPAAHAEGLPPATGFVECYFNGGLIDAPSACVTAYDSGQLTLSPFAGLHVAADYPGNFSAGQAGVIGFLNYSYEVVGGHAGDVVPIDVEVILQASVTSIGYAYATANFGNSFDSGGAAVCSSGCNNAGPDFKGTVRLNALSGSVAGVGLEAEASGNFNQLANGGEAFANVTIHIDSGFTNAGLYSIVLSPGVANATPVPEPASGVLMAVGGALLLARRRLSRPLRGA